MKLSLECPECTSTLTAAKMLPSGTIVNCPGCRASLEFNVHSDVGGGTVITLSRADTVHRTDDGTEIIDGQPPQTEPAELQIPGFVLVKPIGQGGMGTVWEARQQSLGGRRVAIKVLSSHLSHNSEFVQRFQQEAHVLAKLSHPNIVGINDFGADGDLCYIVMEFVEGSHEGQPETVRDQISKRLITTDLARKWIVQVVEALTEAHQNRIVHRDIKPSNVLIDRFGNAKVADFGIASQQQPNRRGLTRGGGVLGTDQYMPPEQAVDSSSVNERADIYACGVMLYEMLSGILPDKHNPALSRMLPDLDPQWDALIARAMDPDPAKRFASAMEMRDAILAIAPHAEVARPTEPVPPPPANALPVPPPSRPVQESTATGTCIDQTCFACGKPVGVDSQFCPDCGVSLLSKCPRCEADWLGGPKYCPGCGFEAQKWQKYVHLRDQAERELQQAQQQQLAMEARFEHAEQALVRMTRAIRYHADEQRGADLLAEARRLAAQLADSLSEAALERGDWSDAREYFAFLSEDAEHEQKAARGLRTIENWRHQTAAQIQASLTAANFAAAKEQLDDLRRRLPDDPDIAEFEGRVAAGQSTLADAQERVKTLVAQKRLYELQQLFDDCRANEIRVPDKLAATVSTTLSKTVPEWLQSIETMMLQEDYPLAFDTAGRLLLICADCEKAVEWRDRAKAEIERTRVNAKRAGRRNLIVATALVLLAAGAAYATQSYWLPAVESALNPPPVVTAAETESEAGENAPASETAPVAADEEAPSQAKSRAAETSVVEGGPVGSGTLPRQPEQAVDLRGGIGVDKITVEDAEQQTLRVVWKDSRQQIVAFAGLNTRDQDYVKALLGGNGVRGDGAGTVAERKAGNKWALLVGVDQYRNLRDLKYCSRDAAMLKERLLKLGFPEDHILLLTSASAASEPTKPNIEAGLDRLLSGRIRSGTKGIAVEPRLVGREDMIIVAFSGHGVSHSGASFFCATEADVERPRDTMISMNKVYSRLAAVPEGTRLLFVDACRNTPTEMSDATAGAAKAFQLLNVPPGIFTLSSCKAGETSMEHPPLKHGVFTYYLQGALGGVGGVPAEDNYVEVRLNQLAGFTVDSTTGYARNILERAQTPQQVGNLEGNPVVGKLHHLDALRESDLAPTYKLGPAAEEYSLNLADVPVPELPEGWRAGDNVTTTYSENGTPYLENGEATDHTITSPRIEMRGDFFIELEASTHSTNFTLELLGDDESTELDDFRIPFRYEGYGGHLSFALPDLPKREYLTLGVPEKYATVLFRIERRGRRYTFIVNSDEGSRTKFIRTYPGHGDFNRLKLTMDAALRIYDLRVGPLPKEHRVAGETRDYRVSFPDDVLPAGWSTIGNPLPALDTYRLASSPGIIQARGDFLLVILARTKGNAHYVLRLLGEGGDRTLPVHLQHSSYGKYATASFPMVQSQSFTATPEKPFVILLMRQRSKEDAKPSLRFSVWDPDAEKRPRPDFNKHAVNGGGFAAFDGLLIDALTPEIKLGGVLLKPLAVGETFNEAFYGSAGDLPSPKQWADSVIAGPATRTKR